MRQGPGSSWRKYLIVSLSSPAGTKFPSPGRVEHKIPGAPHCYLTTNQSEESPTPCSLHPKFCLLKTSPLKPSRNSGLLSTSHPFSFLGPALNISLLQTLTFQFVWPHCASGTQTCVRQHWFSGGFCHKGSWSIRGLCCFNFCCFVSKNRSHSSGICLVSQMSGSGTGGSSCPHRKPETLLSLHHSYLPVAMRVLAEGETKITKGWKEGKG